MEIAGVIEMSTVRVYERNYYRTTSYLSQIKHHPISSTCKSSRWVLENTRHYPWFKYTYLPIENLSPSSEIRHLFLHPRSIFLFRSLADVSDFEFKRQAQNAEGEDKNKHFQAIKSIAIKNVFSHEYKTTARVDTYLADTWYHMPNLRRFIALERLILVKPSVCNFSLCFLFELLFLVFGAVFTYCARLLSQREKRILICCSGRTIQRREVGLREMSTIDLMV